MTRPALLLTAAALLASPMMWIASDNPLPVVLPAAPVVHHATGASPLPALLPFDPRGARTR